MDQVSDFRHIREQINSALKNIEKSIGALLLQEAAQSLQEVNDLYESLEHLADPVSRVQQQVLRNRAARIQALNTRIQDGLARREAGKREDGNLAFKCNWNDAETSQ